MPIAKKKPEVVVDKSPLPVGEMLKEKNIYKTAAADSAINPPESLVLYMEGMPWTVTYYSQLGDRHDDIREIDLGQSAALQQYRKLNNIELRVQSELSQSYDETTGRNDVKGSAVAIGMIPNAYDYFVTDVGVRGLGLFMVTTSTRKTYNNGSVYEIDYILIGYVDSDTAKPRYEALEHRVVKEFHFHKERLQAGQVSLLTTEEHGDVNELRGKYATLTKTYLTLFTSHLDRLLIVPDDDYLYDSRAAGFVHAIVDPEIAPEATYIHRVSHDRDPYLTLSSIWTVILQRNIDMLSVALPKVSKVFRSFFAQNSFLTTTNCWNVDQYVYPDLDAANLVYNRLSASANLSGMIGPFIGVPLTDPIPSIEYAGKTIPLIYEANKNGFYVLSESFYGQDTGSMSLLEILTTNYLKAETPHLGHLATLVNSWKSWGRVEKFYYTPILLVLLKDAVAGYY